MNTQNRKKTSDVDDHGKVIIYTGADGAPGIEVRVEGETVWLSQKQMAELFGCSADNVGLHLKNIYSEGELQENRTSEKSSVVQKEGEREINRPTKLYNLDAIISVGYRVNSLRGTQFRVWATERLKEYLVQGFSMNDEFLKNNGGGRYWEKLLSRIRDIRSSEKMLYRQVLDLYATSVDYDPKSLHSIEFFKIVQNKLHYGAHKQTAAEVIFNRADSGKEFMGLTAFAGDLPVLEEVRIAKNYLSAEELEKLNRFVSAYFELAELRAMNRQAMRMTEHIAALDKLLSEYGEGVLSGAGTVTHEKAMEKAEMEYRKYQAKTLSPVEKEYLERITMLEKKVKKERKGGTNN
ncbi:MAG: virulence RhuM family protein [Candidatus Moraniibacteriota bacterium]